MGFSFISINDTTARLRVRLGVMLVVGLIRFLSRRVTFMRLTLFDNPIFLPGGRLAPLILPAGGLAGISHRRTLGMNQGCREDHDQSRNADGQRDSERNCVRRYLFAPQARR